MSAEYQRFVNGYLNGIERRDGAPVWLLDKLTSEEKAAAEEELIQRLSYWRDDWPIIGLGHLRSRKALAKLHSLLMQARGSMKAQIATAIWKISEDAKMVDVVIKSSRPTFLSAFNPFRTYSMIDIIYCLLEFPQDKAKSRLEELTTHSDYLVSYNAKRALALRKVHDYR